MADLRRCPLCDDEKAVFREDFGRDLWSVQCTSCGSFGITCEARADYLEEEGTKKKLYDERFKLSALCREQTAAGLAPLLIRSEPTGPASHPVPGFFSVGIVELLRDRWPKTLMERLDRSLMMIANERSKLGEPIGFKSSIHLPRSFSPDSDEALFIRDAMTELGWLLEFQYTPRGSSALMIGHRLGTRGWERADDLRRHGTSHDNPAFVAMWFDSDNEFELKMLDVFDQGLRAGAELAGYKASRVDIDNKSNDGVMDAVIARIREAPFVIADYTGNRNGVYFEAGFARGLGKEVVHCCHKDYWEDAHFDIRHLNIVVWDSIEQLRDRVADRILGNLPRGPYKK